MRLDEAPSKIGYLAAESSTPAAHAKGHSIVCAAAASGDGQGGCLCTIPGHRSGYIVRSVD